MNDDDRLNAFCDAVMEHLQEAAGDRNYFYDHINRFYFNVPDFARRPYRDAIKAELAKLLLQKLVVTS